MPDLIAIPPQTDAYKWDVAQLRLTVFPTPSFQLESTLTEIVLGKLPARSTSDNVQNVYSEETDLDNSRLTVMMQPSRIDFVLAPNPNIVLMPGANTDPFKHYFLGAYTDNLSMFYEMVAKWLATKPSLQRLAFSPTLQLQAENRIAVYKILAKFLPKLEIDGEKMSELLYRINRPRQFIVSEKPLRINRISTWSAMKFAGRALDLQTNTQKEVRRDTCMLNLDISTGPEYMEELPKDGLLSIFDKMLSFAEETSQNGDTP